METPKRKPMVVHLNEGRKMFVLGIEITLKLARPETGGDFYLFEALTPGASACHRMCISTKMKSFKSSTESLKSSSMAKRTMQPKAL
jgi:hypothetical protein